MKLLTAAAMATGLLIAGSTNAAIVFSENFNGYTAPIAHGATGVNAATSTTGNTISTDYSYRVPGFGNTSNDAESMYDEGTWTIATNPNAVHDLWVNLPTNNDPMLMLNGVEGASQGNPAESYTSGMQLGSLNVGAGTYAFSYDLLNLCCKPGGPAGTQSFLRFWFSGDDGATFTFVPGSDTSPTVPGVFAQQTGSFYLASAGQLKIGLVDWNGAASGNDFGIDNIVVASVPEPMTWALMIMGFGGVGAMLRSQRRRALAA